MNKIRIYLKKKAMAKIIIETSQIILLNFLVFKQISASFLSAGQICGEIKIK